MKKYRPRVNRVEKNALPPLRVTERDYEIVKAIYDYHMLTSEQIRRLLFDDIHSGQYKCNQRLSKLYHHCYLERVEEPTRNSGEMNKPLCYFLGKRGAELVSLKEGITLRNIAWKADDTDISLWFLEHKKLINDIRILITTSATKLGYTIVDWEDENQLRKLHHKPINYTDEKGKSRKSRLIPDAYFCIQDTEGYTTRFFVEVDRATETIRSKHAYPSFTKKILLYEAMLCSGMFRNLYGGQAFRVLVITTGHERAENLVWSIEEVLQIDYFCVTTVAYLNNSNVFVDNIWAIPHMSELLSLKD